eukprot:CAMPEP_0198113498 /NCGR_PEP_ID=MMETSP1442-20131203/5152_1 /TAXON_ID= /ORGANISM="Craspedostauros australis, Strain CCMP3328" /LENGTH=213 /DNA_ID=CAMNT_0043770611 /DNA_START=235 /DNA_END=876 /DNA_ORIENTATION=-
MKPPFRPSLATFLLGLSSVACAKEILVEDFSNPLHSWQGDDDSAIPGGTSEVHFAIMNNLAFFNGKVTQHPFLNGPGFVKMRTTDTIPFPDISACEGLTIKINAFVAFDKYYVAFGDEMPSNDSSSPIPMEWRGRMENVPMTGQPEELTLPLNDFSNYWDYGNGDIIATCQEDHSVCPPPSALMNLKFFEIWAQGSEGCVSVAIQSIKAVGCA